LPGAGASKYLHFELRFRERTHPGVPAPLARTIDICVGLARQAAPRG